MVSALQLNAELSTVCITFPAWSSRALLTKALTLEDSFGSKGFLQAAQVLVHTCSLLTPLCVATTPAAGKSWHLLGQCWFWCPEKWLWVCLPWRIARADVFVSLLCATSSAVFLFFLLDNFQDLCKVTHAKQEENFLHLSPSLHWKWTARWLEVPSHVWHLFSAYLYS